MASGGHHQTGKSNEKKNHTACMDFNSFKIEDALDSLTSATLFSTF